MAEHSISETAQHLDHLSINNAQLESDAHQLKAEQLADPGERRQLPAGSSAAGGAE